jgi:hypothetical protein
MLAAKLLAASQVDSSAGAAWSPLFLRGTITATAYSSTLGLYVAVGGYGLILTSPDGVTWTQRTSPNTNTFRGVAWTGSYFVAAADSGFVVRSADGINWSNTSETFATPTGVSSNGSGTVVITGYAGKIRYSTDNGGSWATGSSGTSNDLLAVNYANGRFVAVGAAQTFRYSAAGATWSTASGPGPTHTFTSVGYGPTNTWLAGTSAGKIAISTDNGNNWSLSNSYSTNLSGVASVTEIAYANGQWIATQSDRIATTPDPTTTSWTSRVGGSGTQAFYPLAITINGTQVLVAGSGCAVWLSSNSTTYAKQNSGATVTLSGITSSATATNPGIIVVVGDSGTVMTSSDLVNWTVRNSGVTANLSGVAWSPTLNLFMAVGASGVFIYSSDGITWTSGVYGGGTVSFTDIVWDSFTSAFWFVGGTSGSAYKSTTGTSVTFVVGYGTGGALSIGTNNAGRIVASSVINDLAYSSDGGVNWAISSGSSGVQRVRWDGNKFICVKGSSSFSTTTGTTPFTNITGISSGNYFYGTASNATRNAIVGGFNGVPEAFYLGKNQTAATAATVVNVREVFKNVIWWAPLGRFVGVCENGQIAVSPSVPITLKI